MMVMMVMMVLSICGVGGDDGDGARPLNLNCHPKLGPSLAIDSRFQRKLVNCKDITRCLWHFLCNETAVQLGRVAEAWSQ